MMVVSDAVKRVAQMAERAGAVIRCGENPIAAEIKRIQSEARARASEARMRGILGRAAIPPRFAEHGFDTFIAECEGTKRVLASAKEYAAGFPEALRVGRSMLFIGSIGTGKTHLAVGIAHAVIEQGYEALFSGVRSAVRSVMDSYSKDSEISEAQAIQRLVAPDLLILDEVGLQFNSESEKLILFEIMNGRYENMKPTILLSNLEIGSVEKYLGQRVMDRLREGGGKAIAFNWESMRGRI